MATMVGAPPSVSSASSRAASPRPPRRICSAHGDGGNGSGSGSGSGGVSSSGSRRDGRAAASRRRLTGAAGAVWVVAAVAAAAVVAVAAVLVRGAPLVAGGLGGGGGGRSAAGEPPPPPPDAAVAVATAADAAAAAAGGAGSVVDAAAPPPPRVTLLHMYNGVSFFRRLGALTGANKARYAARHGYEFVAHTPAGTVGLWEAMTCPDAATGDGGGVSPGGPVTRRPVSNTEVGCFVPRSGFTIDKARRPTFGKLHLARAACVGRANGWLLWSDADAMVVNQSVPVETLIDDAADFLVTADWLMLQAGVFLVKCSEWGLSLLAAAEEDRKYDRASALDQSALQAVLDGDIPLPPLAGESAPSPVDQHVRWLPKRVLDVYAEEYIPGDFLVHFAGKLYEATEAGLWSIARQFELLSRVNDVADIASFFDTRYLLNAFSGTCVKGRGQRGECKPDDPRRVRLAEPLSSLARSPDVGRYRHVGLRYFWLAGWKDKHDKPGWDRRLVPLPVGATAAVVPPEGGGPAAPPAASAVNPPGGDAAPDGETQFQEPEDGLEEAGPGGGGGGVSVDDGGDGGDGGDGEAPADVGGDPDEDEAVRLLGDGGDDGANADVPAEAEAGGGGKANGMDAEEDDVDGDENDMEGVGRGNDGGWAKWVVMGVLVAGMAGAARVLVVRRRKSPGKAL